MTWMSKRCARRACGVCTVSGNCPAFMLTTSSWSFFKILTWICSNVILDLLLWEYQSTLSFLFRLWASLRLHPSPTPGVSCLLAPGWDCLPRGATDLGTPSSPQPFLFWMQGVGGISKMLFLSFICCTDTETRWRCFCCFCSLHFCFLFAYFLLCFSCCKPIVPREKKWIKLSWVELKWGEKKDISIAF